MQTIDDSLTSFGSVEKTTQFLSVVLAISSVRKLGLDKFIRFAKNSISFPANEHSSEAFAVKPRSSRLYITSFRKVTHYREEIAELHSTGSKLRGVRPTIGVSIPP